MIKYLIGKGADVNAKDDFFGFTPLHYLGLNSGDENIAKLLIKNGANVNATDDHCESTPLHASAESDNYGNETFNLNVKLN